MKISYNWLSAYLPQTLAVEELTRILTGIGLEVEAVEKSETIRGGLEGLVIGEVLSCIPHPNADKLKLTAVDIGREESLSIVCGAQNVAAGQKVVVAPVGTTVHPLHAEPFLIKKAKIRGEVSEGMICAEDEIGLGTSHDGIMVLPENAPTGQAAKTFFSIPAPDYTIEIGLTPNRSDANSHIGVAKDVCAYLSHHQGRLVRPLLPGLEPLRQSGRELPIKIEIANEEACPRYAGVVLAGLKVGSSPEWLQRRLTAAGIHPINNIVDITNFVLHEYGQPLHAFDYDKIEKAAIVVRKAKNGEKFLFLDEKERTLSSQDLMICDAEKPMCMAGVFGGLNSGITENTTRVFLESAYFDPRTIRRSSVHHNLRTDAATHFEKGVAMEMVIPALHRAVSLIQEIAGAEMASPIIDIYPQPIPSRAIRLNYEYLDKLCGKSYQPKTVMGIVTALGFEVIEDSPEGITVEVPGENQDIHQAADLAEEVLRIDGLDNIEIPSRLNISLTTNVRSGTRQFKERIAQYLAYSGLQEIVTNSLTTSKYYPKELPVVRLLNNLSNELDIMRPSMLESGLEVILHNVNRKMQHLKLFEFGKTYLQQDVGAYQETEYLAIWISGNKTGQDWRKKEEKVDIYDLKGVLENIFTLCGIKKLRESLENDQIIWKSGKTTIAVLQAVAEEKLRKFDIKQGVFYAEVDIKKLAAAAENTSIKFMELPKYPSMKRDLALVLDKSIPYNKVAAIAKSRSWEALKNYELFDVFEDEKLGKDKKSLAISFTFQLNERTLTDEEVDKMMKELIAVYQKDLNALVRS